MKVAAFNVNRMGWNKVSNHFLRRKFIKIVSRYSVVVLLEVVDKSVGAMYKFLRELNKKNKRNPFKMWYSKSLGRSSYRERFAYFYRVNEVRIIGSYQYEDYEDVFARKPFILWFHCPNTVVQDLVLIPVHTKPQDTARELDALDDVVEAVRERWDTDMKISGSYSRENGECSCRRTLSDMLRRQMRQAPH